MMDLAEIKKLFSQTRVSIRQVLGLEKRLADLEAGGPGGGGVWGSITGALSNQTDLATALNGKAATSAIPDALSDLTEDVTHRLVTDTEKSTWNGKQDALEFTPLPSAAFAGLTKITVSATPPENPSVGDLWVNIA